MSYPLYHPGPCGWAQPHPGPVVYLLPMVYPAPVPPCCGSHAQTVTVTHELEADGASSPQEALIGGTRPSHLSLEYLVEAGAAAPEVKVTLTSDGTSSTWTDSGIAEGYHVNESFLTAQPGTKVKLEVTDAMARLRWCESVCC